MQTCIRPSARRILTHSRPCAGRTSGGLRLLHASIRRPEEKPTSPRPDPFTFLTPHVSEFREGLLELLGSGHPGLTEISRYYFLRPSKYLRPLLVFLFSQATNGLGSQWSLKEWEARSGGEGSMENLNRALSPGDVINDWNPIIPQHSAAFDPVFHPSPARAHHAPLEPPHNLPSAPPLLTATPTILPTQMRLAHVLEMIHAASLLHDDVIDASPLRRGVASAPEAFGNNLAVLGGNFVLGRASAALARLGDLEVVGLIASIISNLVEGEILQLKSQDPSDAWNLYLQKTYMKTASLMAKGARAAVALGGCKEGEVWREVAYAYGRNLGIAFQLQDDILDYEVSDATLGKPGGADLQLGLATGPALYAMEEYPEMGPLIARKFENEGDVDLARDLVKRSSGVERTRELALAYARAARDALQPLPESEAKQALEALTERVVKRTH
ncbi:terpenoid synthase [Schizophyllum commune Tattone D]|nr:terpenoid synthase [Schizophyllum commune Loenen D]KAI5830274.1 terpenoid synthase [Schizophyllum commune Tattone D]